MKRYLAIMLGILILGIGACDKNKETATSIITTSDFSVTIDENPSEGQVLGSISATTDNGTISYSITSESANGAFAINGATGELSVANKFLFDFETSTILTAVVSLSDGLTSATSNVSVSLNDVEHIWSGTKIIFFKSANADHTLAANQDRITDNVWITRGSSGTLINALGGSGCAPAHVLMAYGTIAELTSLTFSDCMKKLEGSKLSELPGKDVVFYLVPDDTYIDVHFISWSSGSSGGEFSYERTTP